MIDFIKLFKEMQKLKEQIENEISELECNPDRVINLSDRIEKYLSFLFNEFSVSVKDILVGKIKPWSEKIASKCSNSSQLNEIIKDEIEYIYRIIELKHPKSITGVNFAPMQLEYYINWAREDIGGHIIGGY